MIKQICLAASLLLGTACGAGEKAASSDTDVSTDEKKMQQVTGTISYRERILLKPDSVVEVWLLDTSRADAPADELAHRLITEPGRPPIRFDLDYDPAAIDEKHSYSVRATIRRGDRLLFTTDTNFPVLTRGAEDTVELILVKVNAAETTKK